MGECLVPRGLGECLVPEVGQDFVGLTVNTGSLLHPNVVTMNELISSV